MDRRATKIAMPTDDNSLKPKSVIRVQSPFVLLPCRLSATFAEGVAGYAETKRQTRCRQQDERAWKTEERQPNLKSVV